MKILVIIPVCFLLAGCPGGPRAWKSRSTFIYNDTLCFSVNKKDVLNFYWIEVNKGGSYIEIANSGKHKLNTTYPNSCIKFKFNPGYRYVISYGLNGRGYEDDVFFDND